MRMRRTRNEEETMYEEERNIYFNMIMYIL